LNQSPIRAIAGADAAVIAPLGKGDKIFHVLPHQPPHPNGRLGGVESLLEAQRTTKFTDEASGALSGVDDNRGALLGGGHNITLLVMLVV